MKLRTNSILMTAAAAIALIVAPVHFGDNGLTIATAKAAHGTIADGNNGHGNNRNDAGEKADDVSNPSYDPDSDGESGTDGNSGLGDDKNGNNGRNGANR